MKQKELDDLMGYLNDYIRLLESIIERDLSNNVGNVANDGWLAMAKLLTELVESHDLT